MDIKLVISARLTDLDTQLKGLDARYITERAILLAKIDNLTKASALVTAEIQGLVDKLGLTIIGV